MDVAELITLIIVIVAYKITKKRVKTPEEITFQAYKDWQAGRITFEEYYEISWREFFRKHNIK